MSAQDRTMVDIKEEVAAQYVYPDKSYYYAQNGHYRPLNFSTSSENFDRTYEKKPKATRNLMAHRISEKRRRDRMNDSLADLSSLIPTTYRPQGQCRIEKTEVIELAIRHIRNLTDTINQSTVLKSSLPDRYLGFKECQDEVMRYLVEVEGWDAMDKLCARLMAHLEQAGEKFRIMNDESLSKFAKEEQYRHADEEMGTSHKHKKARMMKTRPAAPDDGSYHPQEQVPMYTVPSQVPQEVVDDLTIAQHEPTPTDFHTMFQSFNNFDIAQQVTRDHLKQVTHMWSQYSSASVDDSGVSTDSGSYSSNVEKDKKSGEHTTTNNSKSLNGTGSAANRSSCAPASHNSDSSSCSVYKFKHNITRRFSLEKKEVNTSDTTFSIDNGSEEDNRAEKGKREIKHAYTSQFRPIEAMGKAFFSDGTLSYGTRNGDVKLHNHLRESVMHPVGIH